ncbi:hypothetical protein JRO89_XS07G0296700 [Xanthoceras sorbifolium]|uniref:Reverse transcriptase n=1 Tax=Xanthoceras sorbifolium TaxID=99658 RepID=A0ABQ8HW16_9ROSI|nr:hypothetical protein JRO89_XS07G0296700 [Xanthoceras sorbifolium]
MPYLRGIFIGDEKTPCFVQTERSGARDSKKGKGVEISAKQLEKGLKRGQTTYVAALVQIKPDVGVIVPDVVAEVTFLERLKQQAEADVSYTKLRQEVLDGLVRRYWVEDNLLYAKGSRLYVPNGGGLKQEILKETHDPQWAGHPGVERMCGGKQAEPENRLSGTVERRG